MAAAQEIIAGKAVCRADFEVRPEDLLAVEEETGEES